MTQLYMDKIISGLKTEVIWPDSGELETNSIIPVEIENALQSPKPMVSIMDLGKMLLQSAKLGETSKVHDLMCRGAPFTTDWLGTSPLHLAALNNHYETCEVLLRAGISKDARTKVDRTPLHLAVYEGHEQIVDLLLANKCEVDARDMLKMTPLHWAVEKKHKNIVNMLLRHGADPHATSKFFITPLSIAIDTNQHDVFQELLSWNMKASETEMACDNIQIEDFIEDSLISSSESNSISFIPAISPINTDITKSQHINRKQNEPALTKPTDNEAIQMLKDHGISMLDDTENTLFNSALQNGRKLVLSDAGKLLLNDLKLKKPIFAPSHTISQSPAVTTSTDMPKKNLENPKAKQGILMPIKQIPLKTNKVIKILSADEFKQMCGGNNFKKITTNSAFNGNVRYQAITNSNGLSSIAKGKRFIINKSAVDSKTLTKQNDINVSNVKTIHIQSNHKTAPHRIVQYPHETTKLDIVSKLATITSNTQKHKVNKICTTSQIAESPSVVNNQISESTQTSETNAIQHQPMMLSEIERQILELKKQTEELRKQLELSQKQNDEYKIRLEKLEREKVLEKEERDGTRLHNGSL